MSFVAKRFNIFFFCKSLVNDEKESEDASILTFEAGAEFVKTSTGFGTSLDIFVYIIE